MKFKSRPVKVEQPPTHNLLYQQHIPLNTHIPSEVAGLNTLPVMPVSTSTNSNTWTTPSLTLPPATSPLFSIIPHSAAGNNVCSSFVTSVIPSITNTFSSSVPLMSSTTTTASMLADAVKSLNPIFSVRSPLSINNSISSIPPSPNTVSRNGYLDQNNLEFGPHFIDTSTIKSTSQSNASYPRASLETNTSNTIETSPFDITSKESSMEQHICNICKRTFPGSDMLKKHSKTHTNTSHCAACGQDFQDRLALAKHQTEVHSTDRVFQCPQCEKGFKELRTLRLHLKIHNAEYPEQCNVCQKVFRTKWQLKQHQMDHGGERPYPCPECAFTCKTKQQLNEHRRKHSGEKAYSCTQCNTRFTYRNGLIKHTKLNRCPKKIVTAEGETIVKKRTRISGNQGSFTANGNSETESKLATHLTKEMESKIAESGGLKNNNSFVPFLTPSSTLLNNSVMNHLQTAVPISIFKGTSSLSSPSSPLTTSSANLSQFSEHPLIGYDQGGNISTSITSNGMPSFNLGASFAPPCTIPSSLQSITPTLSIPAPTSKMNSNLMDAIGIQNSVTNVQAALLAASRLIAIPGASIPTSPLLSLSSAVTTTAPSLAVGNGLTTYLNPNLISELLLAGGNIKGASSSIGGCSTSGITHHELPENTTIYPVSDSSRANNIPQNNVSLSETNNKCTPINALSLASLLPNSGTTTIGSMPYGLLGIPSNLPVSNPSSLPIPPTKSIHTTHQTVKDGVLPDSTIAELSAATGLPSADIAAWAAKLPSGSTVKVTRHFDTNLAAMKNKIPSRTSSIDASSNNMFPIKIPDNISITSTQSLLPPPPKLVMAPSKSFPTMTSLANVIIPNITSSSLPIPESESIVSLPQYIIPNNSSNGILTEYLTNLRTSISSCSSGILTNSISPATSFFQGHQQCIPVPSCYTSDTSISSSLLVPSNHSFGTSMHNDSLYHTDKIGKSDTYTDNQLLEHGSICLGLPSYQESFAVDPNEILSKNCHHGINNTNSTLNSQIISSSETNLEQRKRQRAQIKDPNEPCSKATELESSYHDLNSNILNNHEDFLNNENGIDSSDLINVENGESYIFPKFDNSMDDQLLRKITTSNLHSTLLNASDNYNIACVQVPYTYDTRNNHSPSPNATMERKENPPNSFINDANSRLLNSRHLGVEPSKTFESRDVSPPAKTVLETSRSNSITKQDDSLNIVSAYSAGINCTNSHTVNRNLIPNTKMNLKLERLQIPLGQGNLPYGTPPMLLDSGGSSVSSSTYNSAEEGEYSNGAGGEEISTELNPFVFDENTFPTSTFVKSSSKTVDEYLSNNSISSPSTPPPMQLFTNNLRLKKDWNENATSKSKNASVFKTKSDNNNRASSTSILKQQLGLLPPPSSNNSSFVGSSISQFHLAGPQTEFDMEVLDMIPPPTSILGSSTWEEAASDFSTAHELCLNDQDFTSMKSIVEQAFKDGRDVLDIISAV